MAAGLWLPAHAAGATYGALVETLRPHLGEWAACRSETELTRLATYLQSQAVLQQLLSTVVVVEAGEARAPRRRAYRILAWNIQGGIELDGQLDAFREHAYLADSDVLLLNEADLGMARSGNRAVAETLARELGMHYAFAPSHFNLTKGSGLERQTAEDNELGLEGNAILSRYPIRSVDRVVLRKGVDTMAGDEKRVGSEVALAATIEFPDFPLLAVAVHLSGRSTRRHRAEQMREVLTCAGNRGPAILGGDWNTTTTDNSGGYRAALLALRVMTIGVERLIHRHYLHPYRRFEKRLFAVLDRRGFDFVSCNRLGEPTVFLDVNDRRGSGGLRDRVPSWCFALMRWRLREHSGPCPLRLDWFATRDLKCSAPVVLHHLSGRGGVPLSDHDPIAVEILAGG